MNISYPSSFIPTVCSNCADNDLSFVTAVHPSLKILDDGWTAVSKDKSLSAQFEHTVGIKDNGYEIFTESVNGYVKPPYN